MEGKNYVHRAKIWQIAGFALNNSATNLYLYLMLYISYYMVGLIGVSTVLASTLVTSMRIWDGVTDPFIGYLVDKTDSRFGKNRPFMVLGNVALIITSFIMFHVSHNLNGGIRFIFFLFMYGLYIIGYTFQCVATKSAQTCLTNDPKQRPLFAVFDGVYGVLLGTIEASIVVYLTQKYNNEYSAAFFHEYWLITAAASVVLTIIAVISISGKDRREYFGTGVKVRVRFRDYWDVLKNNRAIQMLVVAASTDKLALQVNSNSTVKIIIFGIICGNFALSKSVSLYTTIPNLLFLFIGIGGIATKMGQKKALYVGSFGGLVCTIGTMLLFIFGNPTSLSLPGMATYTGLNMFTILFMLFYIGNQGFTKISGSIVIPMTADCADYEVARSGRYVPGLMGTLFSFVDKLISSLATTLVGFAVALIGFTNALPTNDTPLTPQLKAVGIFLMYGMVVIGLICNLIALKFYPLTKEKMKEVQEEIAVLKAKATAE